MLHVGWLDFAFSGRCFERAASRSGVADEKTTADFAQCIVVQFTNSVAAERARSVSELVLKSSSDCSPERPARARCMSKESLPFIAYMIKAHAEPTVSEPLLCFVFNKDRVSASPLH